MICLYVILFIIIVISLRFPRNEIISDFSGKTTANLIKGIFIWLVFISHLAQYIQSSYPQMLEYGFNNLRSFLGQMIVVPFLFYSGYGVLIGVKKWGGYINTIPSKRVLTVLFNFDVAVLLFIIMDFAIGLPITPKQIILSFIAWDSVGNSNWYIFTIIILYLITFSASKLFGYSTRCIATICVLVFLYSLVMSFLKASWWYDTTFAYAAGSIYCFFKERIDRLLNRHYKELVVVSSVFFILFAFAPNIMGFAENIRSVFLSLLILLFTMRVPLKNKFLLWSGKNLFPLYIYQRIPMIFLSVVPMGTLPLMQWSPLLYITICFVATIFIAYLHKYIAIRL